MRLRDRAKAVRRLKLIPSDPFCQSSHGKDTRGVRTYSKQVRRAAKLKRLTCLPVFLGRLWNTVSKGESNQESSLS